MLHETERSQILRALEMAGGVVSGPHGAAARLRVTRSTLVSRMQKLGIAVSRNYFTVPEKQESLWRASL
jgi:formate hydrogenlyase transcriptional activator